jgi:anti-sigma factor RsiW|eukprot:COSAG01_NODE_1193_length_11306_cov_13.079408_2_plen_159_part_00
MFEKPVIKQALASLNKHDLEQQLDKEITPNEERAIVRMLLTACATACWPTGGLSPPCLRQPQVATNLGAITVFAMLLGRMSDRLNRKSFVLGGLMATVLAAFLGASAIKVRVVPAVLGSAWQLCCAHSSTWSCVGGWNALIPVAWPAVRVCVWGSVSD